MFPEYKFPLNHKQQPCHVSYNKMSFCLRWLINMCCSLIFPCPIAFAFYSAMQFSLGGTFSTNLVAYFTILAAVAAGLELMEEE